MKSAWIVPCRFEVDRPVIYECVEAIQRHHDNPKIVVVDSGSPDKSYFEWCLDHHCTLAPINNQLYGFGAHAWAQRHYPDYDYFYFIFDSLIVQSNCDEFQSKPVTTIRHWHSSQHDWGWDGQGNHLSHWGFDQLDRMHIPRTDDYTGIMGPMMFAQRSVVEELDAMGYWFTQTTSAYLHCAMERVAGISLEYLGYDVSQSLQGVHASHEASYPEKYVAKRNMARA